MRYTILLILLLGCSLPHQHHYTKWSLMNHETRGGMIWDQSRSCTNCGYTQVHIESAIKSK